MQEAIDGLVSGEFKSIQDAADPAQIKLYPNMKDSPKCISNSSVVFNIIDCHRDDSNELC